MPFYDVNSSGPLAYEAAIYAPEMRKLLFDDAKLPLTLSDPSFEMYIPTVSDDELLFSAKNNELLVWFAGNPFASTAPFESAPFAAIVPSKITTRPSSR